MISNLPWMSDNIKYLIIIYLEEERFNILIEYFRLSVVTRRRNGFATRCTSTVSSAASPLPANRLAVWARDTVSARRMAALARLAGSDATPSPSSASDRKIFVFFTVAPMRLSLWDIKKYTPTRAEPTS